GALPGRRHHGVGARAAGGPRARRAALRVPARGLLAAHGHAARHAPAAGAVGLGRGALGGRMAVTPAFWSGRRVLLTGHTGFKGSWLSLWLASLGAEVTGLSDDVPTDPSLFVLARAADDVRTVWADIR